MVGADSIADVRLFLVLLAELHTEESVRHLRLLVGHLADVVEESGTACFLGIYAELCSHDGTQIGGLAAVLEEVLPIAGAVLHLTDETDQLGVHAVDTEVDHGPLTGLHDLLLELLLRLLDHLLDAGGVDAAVLYQLVERETRQLAADGVEAGEQDRLRRVVDDDLDASGCLECADVASLTTDDATLDVVVVDVEDGDRILYRSLGGDALDGLDDDLARLGIRLELGIIDDLIGHDGGA